MASKIFLYYFASTCAKFCYERIKNILNFIHVMSCHVMSCHVMSCYVRLPSCCISLYKCIINIVGVSLGSLPVTRHILIFYECYCVITLYCLCHLHSLNSLSSLSSIQRIQYKYNHRLCQGLEQSSLTPFWTHKVSIIILGPHLQKT